MDAAATARVAAIAVSGRGRRANFGDVVVAESRTGIPALQEGGRRRRGKKTTRGEFPKPQPAAGREVSANIAPDPRGVNRLFCLVVSDLPTIGPLTPCGAGHLHYDGLLALTIQCPALDDEVGGR
jgi:hypothetical protein